MQIETTNTINEQTDKGMKVLSVIHPMQQIISFVKRLDAKSHHWKQITLVKGKMGMKMNDSK